MLRDTPSAKLTEEHFAKVLESIETDESAGVKTEEESEVLKQTVNEMKKVWETKASGADRS